GRLAKIRRLYSDVPPSPSKTGGTPVPARRGICAVLSASFIPSQLLQAGERKACQAGRQSGPEDVAGPRAKRNLTRLEGGDMLRAIPRYGARIPAGSGRIIAECVRQGALVQGPQIRVFEEQLSKYLGGGRAVSASFGR